jgi:elongation factor 1-gamma|eukprot:gnl/Ergobibamus_cyprinoides/2007.p2 GENE.gnl/Ergobibamus_cyprinoides/2007~~gnl/Ergobibamus_cyprinoides/2007.p2  ORF type:complete len:390 (+),score=217.78 gnl/Ergobibamus_cyprinoides/2007:161-1171(+)
MGPCKACTLIDKYSFIAVAEIVPALEAIFPAVEGKTAFIKPAVVAAAEDVKRICKGLDAHLATRTFLASERITFADLAIYIALRDVFGKLFGAAFRAEFPHLTRHFVTIANQDETINACGEVVLAEKDLALAPPKKEKKAAPKPAAAPKAAPKVEAAEEEEEAKPAKKAVNPLDMLPPPPFPIDEWKRFYSNNDTKPTACNWLWQQMDSMEPAGAYSLWFSTYKYNEELTVGWMANNLVGGWHQRLDSARKYIFGSSCLVKEEGAANFISKSVWLFRGDEIPFEVVDCPDSENYEFVRVNLASAEDRALVEDLLAWEGDFVFDGKKHIVGDCRCFK